MAKDGFKVMDSDMHVIEPAGLWEQCIDPAFRDQAPRGLTRWPRDLGIEMAGRHMYRAYRDPMDQEAAQRVTQENTARYQDSEAMGWDGRSQVNAMDREGIDVTVLFPSRGLFVLATNDVAPRLAEAISRAYNNWLYDFCKAGPGRMYGAGMIPPHDVDAAIRESRRCVKDLGFKGVFLRPNRVGGRNWHDPYYDPLWAQLEELGVPIVFHEGGGHVELPQVGGEFETYMTNHTCTHAMGMMTATVSFVGGGVLQRFPKLQAAFLEGNCSWAPWLMWRLDEHYEKRGKWEPAHLKLKPSAYFKRQCFVSVECDEEPARYVPALGYEDNVVFSGDYPHGDSKYPRAVERFLKLPLTRRAKRKFLWDNCARLYSFR